MQVSICQVMIPTPIEPLFYKHKTSYGEIELQTPLWALIGYTTGGVFYQIEIPIYKVNEIHGNYIRVDFQHDLGGYLANANAVMFVKLIPYNQTAQLLYENDPV